MATNLSFNDLLVIDNATANVGVGTTAPNDQVHIYKATSTALKIQAAGSTSVSRLRLVESSTLTSNLGAVLKYTNNTDTMVLGFNDGSSDGDVLSAVRSGASASSVNLLTSGLSGLFIDSTQRVGINTTGPTAQLDVLKNGVANIVQARSDTQALFRLSVGTVVLDVNATTVAAELRTLSNHGIQFTANSLSRLVLSAGGDLTLGNAAVDAERWFVFTGAGTARDYGVKFGTNRALWTSTSYSTATLIGSNNTERLRVEADGTFYFRRASSAGSNSVVFNTTALDALSVNASGDIGVGTASATAGFRLDVRGSARLAVADPRLDLVGTYRSFLMQVVDGASAAASYWRLYDSTASANRVVCDATGNLGIGTNSPNAVLDVSKAALGPVDIRLSNAGVAYMNLYAGSGVGALTLLAVQSEPLVLGTANSERLRISSVGDLGVATIAPSARVHIAGAGAASGPALKMNHGAGSGYAYAQFGDSLTASQNWHIGSEGDGSFRWYSGNWGAGAELMRINSAGNVGIGTDNPAKRLTVQNNQPLRLGTSTEYWDFLQNTTNVWGWLSNASQYSILMNNANGTIAVGTTTFVAGRAITTVADLDIYSVRVGRGAAADDQSTVVGKDALAANTTGGKNTAIGYNTLNLASTANYTVAVGAQALQLQTGGDGNIAIGYLAGGVLTTGQNNIIVGSNAAVATLTTGSSNIIIGAGADTLTAAASNKLVIGSNANYVATNGGPTTYYATAGSSEGYIIVNLNGAEVKIQVFKV